MQSSQRRTSDATSPISSFVLTGSAPASYALVSSAKNRLMSRFPDSRMREFIRSRNSRNSFNRSDIELLPVTRVHWVADMRHTKIVATIGPASTAPEVLDALLAAGVDVFRLNFSHGTHESHREVFEAIREAAGRRARPVAILQDLSGPKIRTGPVAGGGSLTLTEGETLRIAAGDSPGEPGRIFTPFAELIQSARPG